MRIRIAQRTELIVGEETKLNERAECFAVPALEEGKVRDTCSALGWGVSNYVSIRGGVCDRRERIRMPSLRRFILVRDCIVRHG
jgi:hypothetical protein